MTRIQSIELRHLNLPLIKPYALSYRTFESFEPYVVTVCTDDGRLAFGEQHISPGSSSETRDGGWNFLQDRSKSLIGHSIEAAAADLWNHRIQSPVAATALINALDQVNEPERWVHDRSLRIPILSAFSASTPEQIRIELDEKMDLGYRTFKIKVGKDVVEDRQRVQTIQDILGSRGTIRVDANRAYSVKDAIALSQHLDPTICELFEQPCDTHDWEGNGEVAKNSPVPLMLDEPICTMDDIERAATMQGVGFCKVKLKRFGSLEALCKQSRRLTNWAYRLFLVMASAQTSTAISKHSSQPSIFIVRESLTVALKFKIKRAFSIHPSNLTMAIWCLKTPCD